VLNHVAHPVRDLRELILDSVPLFNHQVAPGDCHAERIAQVLAAQHVVFGH
jgi:hypothetical protein